MTSDEIVEVQQFIDSRGVSGMQVFLLVQCFLVMVIDGFDTASIGFIAPVLRADWTLKAAQLAPLFGSGLFGLTLGALAVGPFADRQGRKAGVLWSIGLFGLASLLSALSHNLSTLIGLRFLTGLGLGGAMPNALTLCSEFCPARRRSTLVTLMACGFTVGSALGGVGAAELIATHGWRSVLVVGGVLPLALLPVLWFGLPESARYLAARGGNEVRIRRLLASIDRRAELERATFARPSQAHSAPVLEILRGRLLPGTLLIWLAFFMSLLLVYLLSSWLPTVIHAAGLPLKRASLITAMFQFGGTLGGILIGRAMDRFNPQHVLGWVYLAGTPFVVLIGFATQNPTLLVIAVFGAGVCCSGSQVGGNSLVPAFYPTVTRATGVSWAAGIGRTGSILGSMIGGTILSTAWGLPGGFSMVAIAPFVAGAAYFALGRVRSSQTQILAEST